jgi:alpha-amylase
MSLTDQAEARFQNVLATDLDGTLIPLDGNQQNQRDLQILAEQLQRAGIPLAFVSGRHLASVQQAIAEHRLPPPAWIVCDVGTTIYQHIDGRVTEVAAYREHLAALTTALGLDALRDSLADLDGLRLQEAEKQGRFKLSYYTQREQVQTLAAQIAERLRRREAPYSIVHSVDPFNGDGLIDLLPIGVSKAYALHWWSRQHDLPADAVVFAGDSGNDLAALVAGYRAIVVGNAGRQIADQVYRAHRAAGWTDRLYLAERPATSGVLEGCRWFELILDDQTPRDARSAAGKPLGARPVSYRRTQFRVWAPHRKSVAVHAEDPRSGRQQHTLERDWGGYFQAAVAGVGAGARYRYVLDGNVERPDPTSCFQPDGVHGHSQVIDHRAHPWQDADWKGVAKSDLVIYELHVGTFTEQGTYTAAIERLDEIRQLGVTAVELMPVAQSSGRWNWGYDGVNLFAPRNSYGTPDDLKTFVDACHARGLAVILDVVYNHLGPEGNYLADFGPYFSRKHHTPWGDAFDFDGRGAAPVRQFVLGNALYWLETYHLDGLRLDAVHLMQDDSDDTILDELRRAVAQFAGSVDRQIHLIAEANIFDRHLLTEFGPEQPPYDASWCDDIMHAAYSVATRELQLTDRQYTGWDDLLESLQFGFIYAGPPNTRVDAAARKRLTPGADRQYLLSLVVALQTHDCVGNHPHGQRLHNVASRQFQRAAAPLVLLYPAIPLIFMGEESAAASPFHFFVDFEDPRLRRAVNRGRAREYPQHSWRGAVRPTDERAFVNSKYLTDGDPVMRAWYRSLLQLRHKWRETGWLDPGHLQVDGYRDAGILVLKYCRSGQEDRFVLVRLASANDDAAAVNVRIDGHVLLDSRAAAPTVGEQVVRLQAAHAIIGTGTLDFRPAGQ